MNIKKEITYSLNGNVFIPNNTGIIVLNDVCNDIYNDVFDQNIRKAIETLSFTDYEFILDRAEENGKYGYDYTFINDKKCTTFRFINIECQKDMYAVITVSSGATMKLWVNYNLFSVFGSKKRIGVIALNQGTNTLIMEVPETKKSSTFLIRISDYSVEKDPNNINAMLIGNIFPTTNFGYTKHSGSHLYKNNFRFVFAYYPDDAIAGINDTAEIRITDVFENKVYYSKQFEARKKQEIDISEFDIPNEAEGNTLCATIKYSYNDGREKCEQIPLYKSPTDERLRRVSEKATALSQLRTVTDYDKLALRQGYEYINRFGRELSPILAQATVLRNNIKYILEGKHLDDTVYSPGCKRVFFYNDMYNAVNYYRIYLPKDYSSVKEYPLIIIFSTIEYNDRSKFFEKYTKESIIVVDISMRGMTLGSYIGEAAIKKALQDLFDKYRIDMDRIYCTGISNGGGGAWSQLEVFPDMFAGGYIVSGHPILPFLCNTRNIRIMCLSSKADYMNDIAYKKPVELLKAHPNLISLEANNLSHQMLEFVWFKECYIDLLLSARRNPFPDTVVYRTTSNRHRKIYWLEIHSIDRGETSGSIQAEIKERIVYITCDGITGFSMHIPPQLQGKTFEVVVNGTNTFVFEECNDKQIHFIKEIYDLETVFRRAYSYAPIKDLHKGYGLLDVYLDPLSIVIPTNCTEAMMNTATAYSEPFCNGIIPKIYVQYPIINYDDLMSSSSKAERSYVLIDDGSEHSLVSKIRERAVIHCDRWGWTYKGHTHYGKYCAQQIVNSPWNSSMNILLISCNDLTMLKKNLFTRKLVIPTYSSGRHLFLNNDALIFDENGYHGILDYSCDPIIL